MQYLLKKKRRWKKREWLGLQHLDFYLPEYSIGIECQGEQHILPSFSYSKSVTPEKLFKNVCKLDDLKNKLCTENGIKLLYYAETDHEYRYPLCRNKNDLLKEIKAL